MISTRNVWATALCLCSVAITPAVAQEKIALVGGRPSKLPDQAMLVYPRFYAMEEFHVPVTRADAKLFAVRPDEVLQTS